MPKKKKNKKEQKNENKRIVPRKLWGRGKGRGGRDCTKCLGGPMIVQSDFLDVLDK